MSTAFRSSLRRSLERLVLVSLAPAAAISGAMVSCKSASSAPAAADASTAVAEDGATAAPDGAAPDPCAPIPLDAAAYDPDAGSCADFIKLPCGLPPTATLRNGCIIDLTTCWDRCPSDLTFNCNYAPTLCDVDGGLFPDAEAIVECVTCPGGAGRRPIGLVASRPRRSATPLGAYFASLAHLEAASVRGFRDLARRLRAYGAPESLCADALRAADDERRHARAMSRLARRHGGMPRKPRVRKHREPTFVELLEDNVIEGCVGETFGALLASAQAKAAADPAVARTMRTIAREELDHATLAWEILKWGARRVSQADRDRLRVALDRALDAIATNVASSPPANVRRVTGHPNREVHAKLARGLRDIARGAAVSAFT